MLRGGPVKRGKAAEPPVETTPTSRPALDVITEAVAEGCAAHVVLREEAQRQREADAAAAYAKPRPPMPRLQAAPPDVPFVFVPHPLASAGVEWQRGNTVALDLADWILKMEAGWSYTVGADLWVWITLREGARFTTDIDRVEKLLSVLTDSTPQQVGKSYVQTPRGGKVSSGTGPGGHSCGTQSRTAREGLIYGADSALAWTAPAPWHYVVRSRRSQAYVGDDLIGYSLTIAPTPAGAALAAWAEAYAQDALREPTEDAQPQDRLSGWAARLKERRALWRAYKSRIGVGAEGWQVGF